MSEVDERIAGGVGVLFDERMLDAHLAALLHAQATSEDRFPTVDGVHSVARLYDVDQVELGATFGIILWHDGRRRVWTDAARGIGSVRQAVEQMSDTQAKAYGYFKATVN